MSKQTLRTLVVHDGEQQITIREADARTAALVLRAINHDLRCRIIVLLDERHELTVTDIYVALRIEQSIASQHLSILRKANIVHGRRSGKFIHYSINYPRMAYLSNVVVELRV